MSILSTMSRLPAATAIIGALLLAAGRTLPTSAAQSAPTGTPLNRPAQAHSAPESPQAPAPAIVSGAAATTDEVGLLDVAFPGGSVSDFAQALRKASKSANIVVMQDAADIAVPPMALSQVSVGTAVGILSELTPTGGTRLVVASTGGVDSRTGRRIGAGQPAFVIGINSPSLQQARAGSSQQRLTRVESLSRLLEAGLTAERVLEAVEVAVRSTGLEHETTLAYHEPTRLLVATGSEPSVQAIGNVLGALAPRRSNAELKALDEQRAQLEAEVAQGHRQTVAIQTRAEVLQDELRSREQQLRQATEEISALTVNGRMVGAEIERLTWELAVKEKAMAQQQHQLQTLTLEAETHRREMDQARSLLSRLMERLKANNINVDDIRP
jgi:hypothetical protein